MEQQIFNEAWNLMCQAKGMSDCQENWDLLLQKGTEISEKYGPPYHRMAASFMAGICEYISDLKDAEKKGGVVSANCI